MSTLTERYTVHFPEDYDAQSEYETPSRGYLSEVVVELEDHSRYKLFFIDPVRLQQDLAGEIELGQPYFAEPNLIVLPQVTTASVRQAVEGLVREKFFQHLKPL
jgi:hypothetical protein